MYNEEDYFDDFENEDSNDFPKEIAQQILDKSIDIMVRNNYKAIAEKGIDLHRMQIHNFDKESFVLLKNTIEFMIEHFVKTEEYEKCALLNKHLQEVLEFES